MAELSILNVGTGDTKISFDPDASPEEKLKAASIVKDALRKGYAILVEVGSDAKGPLYRRAVDFDENTCEYIIAGVPPETEEEPNAPAKPLSKTASGERRRANADRAAGKRGGRKQTSRVSASKRSAVAVSRTAGG